MRLHIRNLHFRVAGDDLLSLFSEFGVVTESFVVLDRQTGRSRGFGFLEMRLRRSAFLLVGDPVAGDGTRFYLADSARYF